MNSHNHADHDQNHAHAESTLQRDAKRCQSQVESAQYRFEVGSVYRGLRRLQMLERRSRQWDRRKRVET